MTILTTRPRTIATPRRLARLVAVAALAAGSLTAALPGRADAAVGVGGSVAPSLGCSVTSRSVIPVGFSHVMGSGSLNCSTNVRGLRICAEFSLRRNGVIVARTTTCRTGSGSLTGFTPIVSRTAALSAYSVGMMFFQG